jgi:hypothetical protein
MHTQKLCVTLDTSTPGLPKPEAARQNPCGTSTPASRACRGGDVRFVKCARMLADLAGRHDDRSIGHRTRAYTRPSVFIIDDLVSGRAIAGEPLVPITNRRRASSEHVAQFRGCAGTHAALSSDAKRLHLCLDIADKLW